MLQASAEFRMRLTLARIEARGGRQMRMLSSYSNPHSGQRWFFGRPVRLYRQTGHSLIGWPVSLIMATVVSPQRSRGISRLMEQRLNVA